MERTEDEREFDTLFTSDGVAQAAEILKAGGLVAVPTETVYGLAANGLDAGAVARIYEVKGRPETKPISLLVTGIGAAAQFCRDIPEAARILAEAFWPGPLTMVLWKTDAVPEIVTAGGATVGVRCPAHPMTLELLRLAGVPLATPSANPSGLPSPKDAEQVRAYFDGKIPCILDGGPCRVGVESTVVNMTVNPPKILRRGALSAEDLSRALCGAPVV